MSCPVVASKLLRRLDASARRARAMLRAGILQGTGMAHGLKPATLVGSLILAGCAGTTGEVVPTGADTYMVARHGVIGNSSGASQKARAFQDANAFCGKSGKIIAVIGSHETESAFGKAASGEVEFRCVAPTGSQ